MEVILKGQTLEQILDDFKRLKNSGYNTEKFIPGFYKNTMELFQGDIEELIRITSSGRSKSIFISQFFYEENKYGAEEFKKFLEFVFEEIHKDYPEIKLENGSFEYLRCLIYTFKRYKNMAIGGCCFSTYFCSESENKRLFQCQIVFVNAYRNPFDTVQTMFHEFCHAMQRNNVEEDRFEKLDGRVRHHQYSKAPKEYNKDMVDYYFNNSYLKETEADLFGCMLPLVKALSIEKKELVDTTIKQIENFLFQQKPYDVFGGYFSYPILKDFLYDEEKLKELKKFIGEDGKIDCLGLRNFTKELTLKRQQEYYEDLFKDDTIDYTLLDRNNAREEDRKKFIEEHRNSKFVKDYLEFVEKCREYRPDRVSMLENCLCDLRRKKPRNEEYSKNTLETALKKSELMKELKVFGEASGCLKKMTVEVSV